MIRPNQKELLEDPILVVDTLFGTVDAINAHETAIAKLTERVEAMEGARDDEMCEHWQCPVCHRWVKPEPHDDVWQCPDCLQYNEPSQWIADEPIEPVVSKGHWGCTACGKDWGDCRKLLDGTLPSSKKITFFCIKWKGGCGADAVKWLPDEPPTASEIRAMPKEQREAILRAAADEYVKDEAQSQAQEPNHLKWDGSPLGYVPPPETVHVPKPSPEAVETLKPCPFCKTILELQTNPDEEGWWHRKADCPLSLTYIWPYELAAWNRRPIEDELRTDLDKSLRQCTYWIGKNDELRTERDAFSRDAQSLANDFQTEAENLAKAEAEIERLKVDLPEQNRQIQELWDNEKKLKAEIERWEKEDDKDLEEERRICDSLERLETDKRKLKADLTRANERIERVRKVAIEVIPHKHGEAVLAALDSDKE